jgi:hypothetical protein
MLAMLGLLLMAVVKDVAADVGDETHLGRHLFAAAKSEAGVFRC